MTRGDICCWTVRSWKSHCNCARTQSFAIRYLAPAPYPFSFGRTSGEQKISFVSSSSSSSSSICNHDRKGETGVIMALAYCIWHFPNPISCSLPLLGSSAGNGYPTHLAMQRSNAARGYDLLRFRRRHDKSNQGVVLPPPASLPEVRGGGGVEEEEKDQTGDGTELGKEQRGVALATAIEEAISPDGFMVISACVVGLLTGMCVVLFNNTVHEIRDFFWDGIPARGASWLREEPVEKIWQRVILVPVCGGVMVGMLNSLRSAFDTTSGDILSSNLKAALKPFFKALAASITLGTGNSLGPEGPSVEIGASIAKGVGNLFERSGERRLSLVAAGSAAGIASVIILLS